MPAGKPTARTLSTRQIAFLVAALLIAVMSFQLNATMLAPAIRDIETELGKGAFAAMSTYFYLAGAVGNVVLVRWSDFLGRKKMMFVVLTVLTVGTALCLLSTSLPVVLFGRLLQGVSNVTFALAFLIMREWLPDKTFGLCSGIVTAMTGGVAGVDGLVGGYLSDQFGYRSIFLLIGVVGLLGIVMCAAALPADDPRRHAPGRMDWKGAALIATGVAGINLFFAAGSGSGWASPLALGIIAAAAAALTILVIVERRTEHPLVNIDALRGREAWPLIVVTILNMASFLVVLGFIVPYIAEDTDSGFGLDGLTTALLFITPAAIIQLAVAPLAGRLGVRIGYVTLLRVGQVGGVVVGVLIAVFSADRTLLAIFVALLGLAYMGVAMTAMSILGVVQAPDDEPGALPGIANAAYGIGSSLGFAWAGPVVGSGTQASFALALWICVGIGMVSLAMSMVLRPRARTVSRVPSLSG
ncbi:MFS transporter [Mycolicibacterium flavescens]|uniref:MFS transporter n=1 Tax=Mycolicibacterium flavescens TaxID=1776 RepID=A0A1E3RL50_MYCFV|nr:MFS transporter [Mycolicibacterium flavescens]MCV7282523.1 MFS transporter [Mycolicibacterium flavescens]ODQ90152.1 MFS transporter [Mycolicibacterium flavescens]